MIFYSAQTYPDVPTLCKQQPMEDNMDLADMADQQIEDRLRSALAHTQSLKSLSLAKAGYSMTCDECGEPIPAERHKALPGCATCVDCANLLEQANRLWGRDVGTWWW
jgi:phage/conjugal plasmid C-4 type zinc finger TraR family protein